MVFALPVIKNPPTTKAMNTFQSTTAQPRKYPIAPENAIGRVSRMDAINNKSVNEAALKKAEIKLKTSKSYR